MKCCESLALKRFKLCPSILMAVSKDTTRHRRPGPALSHCLFKYSKYSIHPGTSMCIQVHPGTSMCKYIQVHPGTSRYIQVHPGTFGYIQVHPGTSKYIQVHSGTSKNIQVHPGTPASTNIQNFINIDGCFPRHRQAEMPSWTNI